MALSQDILFQIWTHLDPIEFISLTVVCKHWKNILEQPQLWKQWYCIRFNYTTTKKDDQLFEWKRICLERCLFESEKKLDRSDVSPLLRECLDKYDYVSFEKYQITHKKIKSWKLFEACTRGLNRLQKPKNYPKNFKTQFCSLIDRTYFSKIHWSNRGAGGMSDNALQHLTVYFVIYPADCAAPRYFRFSHDREGYDDYSFPFIQLVTSLDVNDGQDWKYVSPAARFAASTIVLERDDIHEDYFYFYEKYATTLLYCEPDSESIFVRPDKTEAQKHYFSRAKEIVSILMGDSYVQMDGDAYALMMYLGTVGYTPTERYFSFYDALDKFGFATSDKNTAKKRKI